MQRIQAQVATGDRCDGNGGVLAGLEAVRRLDDRRRVLDRPLVEAARVAPFGACKDGSAVGVPVFLSSAGCNVTMVGGFPDLWTVGDGAAGSGSGSDRSARRRSMAG